MTKVFIRIGTIGFILPAIHAFSVSSSVPTGHKETIPVQEQIVVSGDIDLFVRTAGNPSSGRVLLALTGGPGV